MATKKTSAGQAEKTAKATKPQSKKAAGKSGDAKKPDGRKLSQIAAAIQVLAKAKEPMNCKELVEAITKRGLWSSPGGKTPKATLYASILRDLRKGKNARFVKVERGRFALAARK
jgi:hypothetical protein